jgi:hypothetical protein
MLAGQPARIKRRPVRATAIVPLPAIVALQQPGATECAGADADVRSATLGGASITARSR